MLLTKQVFREEQESMANTYLESEATLFREHMVQIREELTKVEHYSKIAFLKIIKCNLKEAY